MLFRERTEHGAEQQARQKISNQENCEEESRKEDVRKSIKDDG